jgi:hypothetical protein
MNYSPATARRNRIEGDITVPAFTLTAKEAQRVYQHQNPEDFVFRHRPGSPPESILSGAAYHLGRLGIIFVGAERDAPAEGRTLPSRPPGHCPRDGQTDYRM